jgi:AcrR family transcriptional regulator
MGLRERQAEQARTAMLEAAIAQLESKAGEDVSMAEIAETAGVSLRTLYRYFPDRASLLRAAGEHVYASLGVPYEITGPEAISSSFLDAAKRLTTRPELTRALVRTPAGRATRSPVRGRRIQAIHAALEPVTELLDPDTAHLATAVITHLCSAASWVFIADDQGLDDTEAQRSVAWAVDVLVSALQQAARTPASVRPVSTVDRGEK